MTLGQGRCSSGVVLPVDDFRHDFNGVGARDISRSSTEYRRTEDVSLKQTFFFRVEYGSGEEFVECE